MPKRQNVVEIPEVFEPGKFGLSKIKTFPGHEGDAVDADIIYDGIRVGHFHDDASGGPPDTDWDNDLFGTAVRQWLKTLPSITTEIDSMELDISEDLFFGTLVSYELIRKACKHHIIYREKDGVEWQLKKDLGLDPETGQIIQETRENLLKRHADVEFYNDWFLPGKSVLDYVGRL